MSFDFDTEVLQRSFSLPVLVDFWAPWCAPCRALAPVLEEVVGNHPDRVTLVKVNTEQHPELAERFRLRSIPNVKLFVDGATADEFTGALPARAIEDWLRRALPSALRNQVTQAEEHAAAGRVEDAAEILKEVLAKEPENAPAAVLLARLRLPAAHREAAEAVAKIGADSEHYGFAEAVRTLARLFDRTEDPNVLPEASVKAQYLAAAAALRQGEFEAALNGLLEVVKAAKNYDDEGARKVCVAVFRFLGDDHPLTRRFRGLLSSALYV